MRKVMIGLFLSVAAAVYGLPDLSGFKVEIPSPSGMVSEVSSGYQFVLGGNSRAPSR